MALIERSQKIFDPVKPGEQWFCYWKTSAALWESKLQEFPVDQTIYIPVNWGFHAEANGVWDFGRYHTERDLPRLIQLLNGYKRQYCWILPISPAPFLPNSGVPINAARTLSLSHQGMHLSCFDQEGSLNKVFSFYDSKVFQAYAHFVEEFSKILSANHARSKVWGAEFFYLENKTRLSFFNDSSVAFEQSFSRYLKKNFPEGINFDDIGSAEKLKNEFSKEFKKLFKSCASDSLAPFWAGEIPLTILGASPRDTVERSLKSGKSQGDFFKDLFHCYISHDWFSSCLLSKDEKKDLLLKCLGEHFSSDEIDHRYQYLLDQMDPGSVFRPYAMVDVIEFGRPKFFEENGLKPYLNENYRWLYFLHQTLPFSTDWIEGGHHRIKFFHSAELDKTVFAQILKLFMMGQKIILDKSELTEDLQKRLEIFFLENNLKPQTVNFLSLVTICELGEGKLILIESKSIERPEDRQIFWGHLFKFLKLNHPEVKADSDVFSLWRIRATSPHELNYMDIRRVNFYNPTSYKKTIHIHTQKKFAFMKVIDPDLANARTNTDGVEVELLPNGKLALDFGHYQDRI